MARSTLNQARRNLYLTSRFLGDVNAAQRHKLGKRIINRAMGRFVSGLMRPLWRR